MLTWSWHRLLLVILKLGNLTRQSRGICTTWMVYLRDFVVSNVSNLQTFADIDGA